MLDLSFAISKREVIRAFRESIYKSFNYECVYCGDRADSLDHAKPKAKGGETVASNLLPSCRNCNQCKGSKELFEWFRAQAHWTKDRESIIREWINGR